MKKEKDKKNTKKVISEEVIKKTVSEDVIGCLIESLNLLRNTTLKENLELWMMGGINEKGLINVIQRWNSEYTASSSEVPIKPDIKAEMPLDELVEELLKTNQEETYKEFIRIQDIDILVNSIFNLQPINSYSYKEGEELYGILINKTENTYLQNANTIIVFESEEERDFQLTLLKDKLAQFQIRFN